MVFVPALHPVCATAAGARAGGHRCHQEGSAWVGWQQLAGKYPGKCLLQLQVGGKLNEVQKAWHLRACSWSQGFLIYPVIFPGSFQFCTSSNEGPETQVTVPGLTGLFPSMCSPLQPRAHLHTASSSSFRLPFCLSEGWRAGLPTHRHTFPPNFPICFHKWLSGSLTLLRFSK